MDKQDDKLKGVKSDDGKLRHDLLPNRPIDEVIKVLMKGADKYEADNWKIVDNWKARYYSAAKRHINTWWDGEQLDAETKLHHLAHAMCSLIFIMENERSESKLGVGIKIEGGKII